MKNKRNTHAHNKHHNHKKKGKVVHNLNYFKNGNSLCFQLKDKQLITTELIVSSRPYQFGVWICIKCIASNKTKQFTITCINNDVNIHTPNRINRLLISGSSSFFKVSLFVPLSPSVKR